MHTLMTCRFCGESTYDAETVVKYGVRHYAHHACYLKAGKALSDLHDWQIISFPYRLIEEHGLADQAQAAHDREIVRAKEIDDRRAGRADATPRELADLHGTSEIDEEAAQADADARGAS